MPVPHIPREFTRRDAIRYAMRASKQQFLDTFEDEEPWTFLVIPSKTHANSYNVEIQRADESVVSCF